MMRKTQPPRTRCAIYTRKSSEEGLEQSFNSLHAQREACEAYIRSQASEGWELIDTAYDDGGFSGGTVERLALQQLLEDIAAGLIDLVMVYKVDRLSRSLADFVRLIEQFDQQNISFVSVTQQFNTDSSMGRLTLNVLLSFAQFEREVTSERIRDKIAASKKKGMWMGGAVPLGYDVADKQLVTNPTEAAQVRQIFEHYLTLTCVRNLKAWVDSKGMVSKRRITKKQRVLGGCSLSRGALYTILKNAIYIGKVSHQGTLFEGKHEAILDKELWQQVQGQLKANRQARTLRTHCKSPSLLAGLLFDDKGNPMSPSHSKRQQKRYRYYVSQALLQYRENDAGSVTRLSAENIESLLIDQIKAYLNNSPQLLDDLDTQSLSALNKGVMVANAKTLADRWESQSTSQQIAWLKAFTHRVTVSQIEVVIELNKVGIWNACLEQKDPEAVAIESVTPIEITVPTQLKRCGIETKLVITNGPPPKIHPNSVRAMQHALLKALTWNQELLIGKAKSMEDIAKREKVTRRYVAYIVQLAGLSPKNIQAIIGGDIPNGLSLEKIKKEPLLLAW